jgi:hypothetical protein
MLSDELLIQINLGSASLAELFTSSSFYIQLIIACAILVLAYGLSRWFTSSIPLFSEPAPESPLFRIRKTFYELRTLCFPVLLLILLYPTMAITD